MAKLTRHEILGWLRDDDPVRVSRLFRLAYARKRRLLGKKVYLRGLIEYSNICAKDCYYCGIRKSNAAVERYRMELGEIESCARRALELGYGSVVLQSGERNDTENAAFVEEALRRIRALAGGELGVTLSLGEQDPETYERWFAAGAHRYLLRIETSNPELYGRLHPEGHSWERRRGCLRELKRIGYQVGTGMMFGLPGQTPEDLADDLEFLKAEDADMIGAGPYIVHRDTPLAIRAQPFDPARQVRLALKMIALMRLSLEEVNIAATTALQALDPHGREKGLLCGANIIMPSVTPAARRSEYRLYDGKPCVNEGDDCGACMRARIAAAGEEIGFHERGDSPHYFERQERIRKEHWVPA